MSRIRTESSRRLPRRIVSFGLSANYIRFRNGQMVLVALILAIMGISAAAVVIALER